MNSKERAIKNRQLHNQPIGYSGTLPKGIRAPFQEREMNTMQNRDVLQIDQKAAGPRIMHSKKPNVPIRSLLHNQSRKPQSMTSNNRQNFVNSNSNRGIAKVHVRQVPGPGGRSNDPGGVRHGILQQPNPDNLVNSELHFNDGASEAPTEQQQFVSNKNPHKSLQEQRKRNNFVFFAVYDHLADTDEFRAALQKLKTHTSFPQTMFQLIVQGFELSFGREKEPEPESYVVDNANVVKPYLKKAKNKVCYVQVYLLPQEQLHELTCHLTGCEPHQLVFPDRFRSENPFKLPTPMNSYHSVLTKLCKFDSLDMLCLNCDEDSIVTREIPPISLVQSLFKTYTKAFTTADTTEHMILFYLHQLDPIRKHFKQMDLLQVAAPDLIERARILEQEEPTIMDEANQSDIDHNFAQDSLCDFGNRDVPPNSNAFRINLNALPLLPSEAYSSAKKQLKGKGRNEKVYGVSGGFIMSSQNSVNSLIGQSQEKVQQVQDVLSMVSQKGIGHGGRIISGLYRDEIACASHNGGSETSGVHTLRTQHSELSVFGNHPFNQSNLDLSVGGIGQSNRYHMLNAMGLVKSSSRRQSYDVIGNQNSYS